MLEPLNAQTAINTSYSRGLGELTGLGKNFVIWLAEGGKRAVSSKGAFLKGHCRPPQQKVQWFPPSQSRTAKPLTKQFQLPGEADTVL